MRIATIIRRPADVLPVLALALLFTGAAPASRVPGDASAVRTLLDTSDSAREDWEVDEGVSVAAARKGLVVVLDGKQSGWAAARNRTPVEESAKVSVAPAEVQNGAMNVQLEWFSEKGDFVAASDILDRDHAAAGLSEQDLAVFFPKDKPKPAAFRTKFWLEGAGARVPMPAVKVVAPLAWREPGTKLVRQYTANSRLEQPVDKSIKVQKQGDVLVLGVPAGTPSGSIVFAERVPYRATGVVLLDIAKLRGGVSLQAVSFDAKGKYLSSVDLLKDATEVGASEVPLRIYKDQFPAGTATLAFKLWLANTGNAAEARVRGLYYGQSDGAGAKPQAAPRSPPQRPASPAPRQRPPSP
jgi:hypothetical protein